ncbi:MAG: sigma 54-interacting transcriptional regulator [Bacteroidales bacterium]|jgi:DNA-binding NtrC family response regulator|nr:sigma 54-interacting transcriptional regulator [Bacteroidales bacterium]
MKKERIVEIIDHLIYEVAKDDKNNILICGEEGTGKEHVAKRIVASYTEDVPFAICNITPSTTFEKIKPFILKANGGTLCLDEIGDLKMEEQKLLHQALQSKEIDTLPYSKKNKFSLRLICTTNKELQKEIIRGSFNKNLYNLINGFTIELPPLRDYGEEILELAEGLIFDYCKKNHMQIKYLSSGARDTLLNYSYPKNHRELRAIIELTLSMSNSSIIYPDEIYLRKSEQENLLGEELPLREYESRIIKHFLDKYDNKVYFVAKKLDVSKNKIYNVIQRSLTKSTKKG